jgi:hypothetical protein
VGRAVKFGTRHGGAITLAAAVLLAVAAHPTPSHAVCSVLSRHPCIPRHAFCSVLSHHPCGAPCSVFRRLPCTPDIGYPFGEQLQLTIESRSDIASDAASGPADAAGKRADDLSTIRAVFAALRQCWVPPDRDRAHPGTQLSVRLSFKRNGDMFGRPRLTYVTPGTSSDVRQIYWDAVSASLQRCVPMHFSAGLGGALAGRPIAVRFVDARDL